MTGAAASPHPSLSLPSLPPSLAADPAKGERARARERLHHRLSLTRMVKEQPSCTTSSPKQPTPSPSLSSLTASPYPPPLIFLLPRRRFLFSGRFASRTSPSVQRLVSSSPRQHLSLIFLHSLLVLHFGDNSTSREGLSTLLEQRQNGRSTAEAAAVALNFHTKLATVMKGLDYPHEPNKEPPDRHEPFKTGWL